MIFGDFCGHGIKGAIPVIKMIKELWPKIDLHKNVLETMQNFVKQFKYVFKYESCELCYLQLKNNEIFLSNAGIHIAQIRNNQWKTLGTSKEENFGSIGRWLANPATRDTHIELKVGDVLVIYTDGLYENHNQYGKQFGIDNFKQLILQNCQADVNVFIDTVFSTVHNFCLPESIDDDEALLFIRCYQKEDIKYKLTNFYFFDPAIEQYQITTTSLIDSARQQFLYWLKGKTSSQPSIDKILIYQWQNYEIGIGLKLSEKLGGDFYDLFKVFDGKIGILINDLQGHGIDAAINISKAQNLWSEIDLNQDVLPTMQTFEQKYKNSSPKIDCSLCYLQICEQKIDICNAGLFRPMLITNNIITELTEQFLTITKTKRCNEIDKYSSITLQPGETLVVYTDGLIENSKQFGQENLKQLLLDHQQTDLKTIINTVFTTVYEHCQPKPIEDDETLLVIRRITSTTN
ncbi:SpoIIE family protein phosphatase [Candidatus Halobeggiatoa sp. HSG11]|nr:SpoIIE family protein phosphatase [Candidatus Halobeggiatoa sp. HSG11]